MNIHRRVLEERGWKDVHRDINPNGNPFLFGISPDGFSLIAPAADGNFAEELLREMAGGTAFAPHVAYYGEFWEASSDFGEGRGSTLCEAVEKLYLKFKGIEL